jgi:hypothetical protein
MPGRCASARTACPQGGVIPPEGLCGDTAGAIGPGLREVPRTPQARSSQKRPKDGRFRGCGRPQRRLRWVSLASRGRDRHGPKEADSGRRAGRARQPCDGGAGSRWAQGPLPGLRTVGPGAPELPGGVGGAARRGAAIVPESGLGGAEHRGNPPWPDGPCPQGGVIPSWGTIRLLCTTGHEASLRVHKKTAQHRLSPRGLPRTSLPRTPVNEGNMKGRDPSGPRPLFVPAGPVAGSG